MGHEVAVNSYEDLMFGRFNTPAALDDLIYLLDWGEMYSAVELPAAAILVPDDPAENGGDLFSPGIYAIFGAERNAKGWKVRGILYSVCSEGFQGQLSRDCTVLTCESGAISVNVRFFGEHLDKYVAVYGILPTQDNLNGQFSGNFKPRYSSGMVKEARRAIREIIDGTKLRDAIIGGAKSDDGRRDLRQQAAILEHLCGWYRAYRRNQALVHHRLAPGEATEELSSVPAIREAVARANRELGIEKARIDRSERSL